MKIDIHTHTKKCKTGDAPTREITPADFCEAIRSTEVGIIAITNHNVFHLQQYKEITDSIAGDAQIWPGIELDVLDNDVRGHLLVIVSPKKAEDFFGVVDEITKDSTPDSFTITIEQVLERFDAFTQLPAGTCNPRHALF